MKFGFKNLAMALGTLLMLSPPTNLFAQQDKNGQDIEIMNQDGEKVGRAQIELVTPRGNRAGGGIIARGGLTNGDGKIIVVGEDGETREIDVSNAQSIIVNQGVKSIMVDGQEQRQTFGKAIVIGPDGVRQEFELAPNAQGNVGQAGPQWNQIEVKPMEASYMIGVNCEPVPEVLSAQLQLDTGTGLIVARVSNDGPAAAAGIQQHDILMFVEDTQLTSVKQLSELVQAAGKSESSVSISLIRAGKEKSVEVSPVERPAQQSIFNGLGGGGLPMQFEFRQIGPGGLMNMPGFDDRFRKQFDEQIKEMRKEMEKMNERMRQFKNPGGRGDGGEDF